MRVALLVGGTNTRRDVVGMELIADMQVGDTRRRCHCEFIVSFALLQWRRGLQNAYPFAYA